MAVRGITGKCFLLFLAVLCALAALLNPGQVLAQSENTRVFWQIDYDSNLTNAQKTEVQGAVLQTLARAKERHFAGDAIISQKIKKEGLNFPDCFTEGRPCASGGAFVLDVHNVDAFAKATFSNTNGEWKVSLSLWQEMSSTPVQITRTGNNLTEVMQMVAGSLFEMESGIEITSTVPDVEIYVNQKLIGTTPLNMKIPVGNQAITFKKSGYVSETWEFDAEKGKIYSKEVDLRPEETQLTVLTTADDAIIYIDDEEWGTSNQTKNILPGTHKIEVRSDTHHEFTQEYKVSPGTPQTMQVAPRPLSRSPYEVRHRGILKYRLSTTIGYHFAGQKLRMPKAKYLGRHPDIANDVYFHGISAALNYENQYFGVSFFRLDLAGANPDFSFAVADTVAKAESTLFVGFYPAQFKAHYTFWVMQAEAVAGVGLSYMRLTAKDSNNDDEFDLKQLAFSIDFSVGLKYYFTEESFAMLAYDLQFDTVKNASPRHGLTIALGFQLPFWMRSTEEIDAQDEDLDIEDDSEETDANAEDSAPDAEETEHEAEPEFVDSEGE